VKHLLRISALALVLTLAGCCTCAERYDPALAQWQENLEEMRPTMQAGADLLPDPDLTQTKMDRYDRTIQGIKRVRGEGPEVFTATPQVPAEGEAEAPNGPPEEGEAFGDWHR